MADAHCHYCTRPAQEECHACGRLYCAEHGEDVCLRCLSPEAATPSPVTYRGALLAFGVAAAVAIYLIISPPSSESTQDAVRTVPAPTEQVQPTATPTPEGGSGTPGASATATVAAGTTSATPGGEVHVVAAGDSLSSIAAQYGVELADLLAANPGLTEDTPIQIGQEITIPGQ